MHRALMVVVQISENRTLGFLGPGIDALVDGHDEGIVLLLRLDEALHLGGRLGDRHAVDVELVAKALDVALHVRLVHGGGCGAKREALRNGSTTRLLRKGIG